MPPEKIDSLADDVKPLVLELLRQISELTVRVNELLAQNKALLARIAELEDKLARADIIDISKLSGDTIKFGATVTVIDEDTEVEKAFQIVGESEADVKAGKVSITSPTARAPNSTAESGDKAPWKRPMGVRKALRMTG